MIPFELTVRSLKKTGKGANKEESKKVKCFAIDIIKGRETKVKFFVYTDGAFVWIDSAECTMTEAQLKLI